MRNFIFKYRGILLLPPAFIILVFGKPSVISFLAGSLLIFAGELLRVWGVGYAGKTTRSDHVEAPFLVTAGPYSYVRNPLYAGNFLIGLGFSIMAAGGVTYQVGLFIVLFFIFSAFIVYGTIIPLEEAFLNEKFGEDFVNYKNYVPRIFPWKKPYETRKGIFSWEPVKTGEIHTFIYLGLAYVIFLFKLIM
ncbi:MAG: isoprenylcysteine carboxylmethyltransferase family protein [Candidatus Eremiobacterota bacterium]